MRADMVWVPDLALGPQTWGLGSALPRAVPSDAVIGLLDEVVPGALLQSIVLLASLVGGAWGARALVPRAHTVARLVAVTWWVWNPFVAERLLMGHWPVLVGTAVLPWLVVWARLPARRRLIRYSVVLPWASLSAGAGVASATVALLAGWRDSSQRARLALVAVVAASNAPWIVAGLAHGAGARSSSAGAEVFAARAWGDLPVWLQVLDLGGIWNADAVLDSRHGAHALVSVVVVMSLAAFGWRTWLSWTTTGQRVALIGAAAVGWGIALLGALLPELVGWLAQHVAGAGLLRDSSRFLALAAPGVVLAVAAGADRVVRCVPGRTGGAALSLAVVLAPVALLPDLAWGASGRLDAVDYPPEFAAAARALQVDQAAGVRGDVLLMPFSSYRAPAWNAHRKVIDPSGRYVTSDFVTNDALVVGEVEVAGEDPRAVAVLAALKAPSPAREVELRRLGIAHVLRTKGPDVDRIEGPKAARVRGTTLFDSPTLQLVALEGAVRSWPGPGRLSQAAVYGAWGSYFLLWAGGIGAAGWRAWARLRTKRGQGHAHSG